MPKKDCDFMFFKQINKTKLFTIVSLIVIAIILFLIIFSVFESNRMVGHITENKIYYKDQIYVECYDVFNFNVGKCLGMIDWTEFGYCSKIYSIKNRPGYIYLSMTNDYRIYKLTN